MLDFIETIIYFVIYFILLFAFWLILYPIFSYLYKRWIVTKRFRFVKSYSGNKKRNRLIEHIKILLATTYSFKTTYYLISFFVISFIIFLLSFAAFLGSGRHVLVCALLSMLLGLIPYFLLRIKLYNIRILSSYEAEGVISEIISQYKINHLNMIEALDQTVPKISDYPYSQRALFKLSVSIKQYRDENDLEDIIKEFNYSLDTSWSFLLATNLFLSIGEGENIYEALEDILDELRDLRNIYEKNRQYNNETLIMIKYITPGIYLLSVYTMFAMFGFDFNKYINYQFIDPIGFKFFILIVIFIVLNYFVYIFLKRQKNDF